MKKIILASPRGFCAGVRRAIDTVERALEIFGAPVYVKHEIVHNKHVVNSLKNKGAIFIEDISTVPAGAPLIYSAHGVSPQIREEAKSRHVIEIDATCGLVTKIHSAVKRFAKKGYKIVLIGHKNHVEVIGTAGEAPEATTIVEKVEDVSTLPFTTKEPLFYTTQTTLSLLDVKPIEDALKARFPQIETLPSASICYATSNRQLALLALIPHVDGVLVVGDPSSSNSNRLKELAAAQNKPAYLINSVAEIQDDWLPSLSSIAITAGASSPEDLVQACIKHLQEKGFVDFEEQVFIEESVHFALPSIVR